MKFSISPKAPLFLALMLGFPAAFLLWGDILVGYRVFHIPTASMLPYLQPGDYVLVNTWAYQGRHPARSDVVVFKHPYKKMIYVKRVSHVAGDVFMGRALQVGEFSVQGDNVEFSEDSRVFGVLNDSSLVGRVESVVCCQKYIPLITKIKSIFRISAGAIRTSGFMRLTDTWTRA